MVVIVMMIYDHAYMMVKHKMLLTTKCIFCAYSIWDVLSRNAIYLYKEKPCLHQLFIVKVSDMTSLDELQMNLCHAKKNPNDVITESSTVKMSIKARFFSIT